jgi:hypothetical protein
VEHGGFSSLRRGVQALLDCGMICEEEVAFLYAVIAEEAAARCHDERLPPRPAAATDAGRLMHSAVK